MYSLYVVLDGLYLFLFCMNYPLYMLVSDHLLDLQILLFPISYHTLQIQIEINISSARDLRSQLREIAPMNNEGSKLFCPNGESSAGK